MVTEVMTSPYAVGSLSSICAKIRSSLAVTSFVVPAQMYRTSGFRVMVAAPGGLNLTSIATRLPAGTSLNVAVYLFALQATVPLIPSLDVGLNQSFQWLTASAWQFLQSKVLPVRFSTMVIDLYPCGQKSRVVQVNVVTSFMSLLKM